MLLLLSNDPRHYDQNKESDDKDEENKGNEIDLDDIPQTFVCPISQELMVDPVIAGIESNKERKKNNSNSNFDFFFQFLIQ